MRELGPGGIAEIIQTARSAMEHGYDEVSKGITSPLVIGSAFSNASPWDSRIGSITAARLGCSYVDFPLEEQHVFSSEEILEQLAEVSRAVDILLTAYVDNDTFGAGHLLTMRFPTDTLSSLVSVRDDVFANQPGLAELLGLYGRLGGLENRRVVITWGFGSRFALPGTAHSLMILALLAGSRIRVVSPPKFPLLRRVIREASSVAKAMNTEFEEVQEFEGSFKDADAVFALNWCRLDDFNHPERFAGYATEFKDWHFTSGTLPEGCTFATESPVETDLLAAPDVIHGSGSLVSSWLSRRVSTLVASIDWILRRSREGEHVALV